MRVTSGSARANDVAAVNAAKASILPTVTPLGVTGTQPGAVLSLSTTPGATISWYNVYGALSGFTWATAGLKLGAVDDASKACLFTALACSLTRAGEQTLTVYDNLLPWTLTLTQVGHDARKLTINAAGCNLTSVTLTPADGITALNVALDISDNALTQTCINALFAVLYNKTVLTSASLDISGDGVAYTLTETNCVRLSDMMRAGWTVTVPTLPALVITVPVSEDASASGTYELESATGDWVKDATYRLTKELDAYFGAGYFWKLNKAGSSLHWAIGVNSPDHVQSLDEWVHYTGSEWLSSVTGSVLESP